MGGIHPSARTFGCHTWSWTIPEASCGLHTWSLNMSGNVDGVRDNPNSFGVHTLSGQMSGNQQRLDDIHASGNICVGGLRGLDKSLKRSIWGGIRVCFIHVLFRSVGLIPLKDGPK